MWSIAKLCRGLYPIRSVSSKILHNTGPQIMSRELLTPAHCTRVGLINKNSLRISQVIKSNGIIARFCSSGAKSKSSKAVGYWLLGCSGMVFTAVVLGMVAGYMILLYSVYYIINIILRSTNGSK